MAIPFRDSGYGRRFFKHQFPMFVQELTRIADSLEAQRQISPSVQLPAKEDGSLKCYRLNLAEVHYGSVLVAATSKQLALDLTQAMIADGKVV